MVKKRIKLKKYKRKSKSIILNKFLLIITFVVIGTFYLISMFNKKATPILLEYAELETKKLSTIIINRAISKQIANNIDLEELIVTTKNNNNQIQSVDFNPYIVNKTLNSITNSVQINLKYLEEGKIDLIELPDNITMDYNSTRIKEGIIYELPMGAISKNTFLSNLGPKIPVRLNLIGSVEANINTKATNYGINNVIIEIGVKIKVTEKVSLPFSSKTVSIETNIPIAIKLIEGSVPNYYSNGLNNSSSFSIPITE